MDRTADFLPNSQFPVVGHDNTAIAWSRAELRELGIDPDTADWTVEYDDAGHGRPVRLPPAETTTLAADIDQAA